MHAVYDLYYGDSSVITLALFVIKLTYLYLLGVI